MSWQFQGFGTKEGVKAKIQEDVTPESDIPGEAEQINTLKSLLVSIVDSTETTLLFKVAASILYRKSACQYELTADPSVVIAEETYDALGEEVKSDYTQIGNELNMGQVSLNVELVKIDS